MRFTRPTPIQPGMRFMRLVNGEPAAHGGRAEIWQVMDLKMDPSGIEHARLAEVDHPNRVKTLSAMVLRDPSRYRRALDDEKARSDDAEIGISGVALLRRS